MCNIQQNTMALLLEKSAYLSGTARRFFIALICWKWFDMSVARTSSITSDRNSLQSTTTIYSSFPAFYPHMPIGKVWICRLLFVCLFVRLRISPPRIKLAASDFARQVIGVPGRQSHIFVNFTPQNPKIEQNRPARGARPPACKHYRRDAPT